MINNNIVLFDMDGTLTEPRGKFNTELLLNLRNLSRHTEIGILTGSDLNYIESQMLKLIKYSEIRFKTHLLPCNGTKHLLPPKYPDDDFKLVHENNKESHLKEIHHREILKIITQLQADVCFYPVPLTGHFVNYRGSMINWCPIGRNASAIQRKEFVNYDNETGFRKRFLKALQHKLSLQCPGKVEVKLGGETSFDIFPVNWDKTYALRHFEDKTCWFVGDRCEPSGNDYEIYEALKGEGRAFKTRSPLETGWIINEQIMPKLKHL